jgi:hypothetical protein
MAERPAVPQFLDTNEVANDYDRGAPLQTQYLHQSEHTGIFYQGYRYISIQKT